MDISGTVVYAGERTLFTSRPFVACSLRHRGVIRRLRDRAGPKCTRLKEGDEVFATCGTRMAGFAEYVTLAESVVALRPNGTR